MDKQSLTQKAAKAFLEGDYSQALNLYKEAADIYGETIFGVNIILCERKLARTVATPIQESSPPTIEQQLVKTQQLLEHYFNRAQELEYQLIDKQ